MNKAHPTSAEAGAVAPTDWETERAQLVKSRDEALEKAKVCIFMPPAVSQPQISR